MLMLEALQKAKRAISLINNMICRGILKEVTAAKTPTAKVTCFNDETYDGIEFAQDYGFISRPPVDGTEVLVQFIGGQRDHGTVLKSFNKEKSFKKLNPDATLEPGEVAIHNAKEGTYIRLKIDGEIEIHHQVEGTSIKLLADGSIEINSTSQKVTIDTPEVIMTGNLTVHGDVLDNSVGAHINVNKVRDMRTIYNAHVHSGIAVGGANTQDPTTDM